MWRDSPDSSHDISLTFQDNKKYIVEKITRVEKRIRQFNYLSLFVIDNLLEIL